LQILLLLLGLVVFVAIPAVLVPGGLVPIVTLPYSFVTKKAEVVPGGYGLGQVKEK